MLLHNHTGDSVFEYASTGRPRNNREDLSYWAIFYLQIVYVLTIISNQGVPLYTYDYG